MCAPFPAGVPAARAFDIRHTAASYRDIQALLDAGAVKAALVVPPDYAARLAEGHPAKVQVLLDGSDPTAARTAFSAAQLIVQHHARAVQEARIAKEGLGGWRYRLRRKRGCSTTPIWTAWCSTSPG